jgi:sugar lactone lactonase YvrE
MTDTHTLLDSGRVQRAGRDAARGSTDRLLKTLNRMAFEQTVWCCDQPVGHAFGGYPRVDVVCYPQMMGIRMALLGIVSVLVASGLFTASEDAEASRCPDLVTGSAPRLHPEGVAYSPALDRFLVGSVTHGTVSVVQPGGSVRTLVDDPVLITTMGLAVDARRGRLLVVNGDVGISEHSTPDTIRRTAGLGIYDLRTGHRIAYHDLGALDPDREHFGNDVAIAKDGTAFVTDSFNGAVYRVPVHGRPNILIRDDRLTPAGRGNGANGIVLHPNGSLLIAHSSGHAVYKLVDGQLTQVTVDQEIGAPDGLLLNSNGALHAIDNTSANRVVTLDSTDDWTTARLTDSQSWPDPAPTTMARGRCGIYVLSGRLDQLPNGSDEFLLRKLDRTSETSDSRVTTPPPSRWSSPPGRSG